MLKILILSSVLNLNISNQSDTIPLINSNEIILEVAEFNKAEKYDQSIDLLKQISVQDSNYVNSQLLLINSLSSAGKKEKATLVAERLITDQLDLDANFYITYGNVFVRDNPKEAERIYMMGLDLFPYEYILLYNLGLSKFRQGDYESAVVYMQETLKINPFYSSAHFLLGTTMSLTNQRTKAVLSYMTSLAVNNENNSVLVRLNNLCNDAFREEGKYNLSINNDALSYYDDLLRSKVVFDERYQSNVSFTAPVAQQCELLISKLKYKEGTGDFWMDFYVPFYETLNQKGYTQGFIYHMLYSTNNDNVKSWLEKNEKVSDEWFEIANTELTKNRDESERTVNGVTKVYEHWYYDDTNLSAIGNVAGENNIGEWEYYYANGFKKAYGKYNNQGLKIGEWVYYYDNGSLSGTESYDDNGNLSGEIISYKKNGSKYSTVNYKEGELTGNWQYFYNCGGESESFPYVNGKASGKGKSLYKTGGIYSEYNFIDDDYNGDYIYYYKNGQISAKYNYKDGIINGPYISYHENSKLYETGDYKDGELEGEWITYFDNQNINIKGSYSNGKKIGDFQYYYYNGKLSKEETYNELGEKNGIVKLYDEDGKIYSKRTFKNDLLVGYEYINKEGAVIEKQENQEGNLPFKSYYPYGQLSAIGTFVNGKLNGDYKSYHINGKISQEGTMNDDTWAGKVAEYDRTGVVKTLVNYKDGKPDGYYRSFYKNGEIEQEGWYIAGNLEQTWNFYYPNGKLKTRYEYLNDQLVGELENYSVEGKLFSKDIYENTQIVGINQYDSMEQLIAHKSIPNGTGEITLNSPTGLKYKTSKYICGENGGEITYFYSNGKESSIYGFDNGEITTYTEFFENGKISVKGNYLNENRDGKWTYYYEDGKLSGINTYQNGKLEGESISYYENGELEYKCNYYQDKRHGACTYWDQSGNVQLIKHYVKDLGPIGYQYYKSNNILSDTIYINPQDDKVIKAYFPNGNVSVLQEYKGNYYNGQVIFYNTDGSIISKDKYVNGDLTGESIVKYSNGSLLSKISYSLGYRHGTATKYYKNGKVREEISYQYDVKHGWKKEYSQNGELISKKYFWNGFEY